MTGVVEDVSGSNLMSTWGNRCWLRRRVSRTDHSEDPTYLSQIYPWMYMMQKCTPIWNIPRPDPGYKSRVSMAVVNWRCFSESWLLHGSSAEERYFAHYLSHVDPQKRVRPRARRNVDQLNSLFVLSPMSNPRQQLIIKVALVTFLISSHLTLIQGISQIQPLSRPWKSWFLGKNPGCSRDWGGRCRIIDWNYCKGVQQTRWWVNWHVKTPSMSYVLSRCGDESVRGDFAKSLRVPSRSR